MRLVGLFLLCLALCACNNSSSSGDGGGGDDTDFVGPPADGVAEGCGSVRMTQYGSSDRRACGFDRSSAILPQFVRDGMTVAMSEPWFGGSYDGDYGEACGECWELSTVFGSEIVMVHDICPIEGNPICAGSHFHFDVSNEVADAVDGGQWMGEAAVRRVPCPVTGNIHVYITARNEWGYLQIAFFNHRFPIRQVEYRAADGSDWLPLERCLARWCLEEDMDTFAQDGPGGVFRFTSAAGEVVEGSEVMGYNVSEGSDFDCGAQFDQVDPPEGTCVFEVPGDVYDDDWGGIDGVTWDENAWDPAAISEVTDNCAGGSAACLRLTNPDSGGLHLTYRHTFPVDTFETLTLDLRADGATGTLNIAPRTEEGRCEITTDAPVTSEWTTVTLNIADSCPAATALHGLTISHASSATDIYLDNILFE